MICSKRSSSTKNLTDDKDPERTTAEGAGSDNAGVEVHRF